MCTNYVNNNVHKLSEQSKQYIEIAYTAPQAKILRVTVYCIRRICAAGENFAFSGGEMYLKCVFRGVLWWQMFKIFFFFFIKKSAKINCKMTLIFIIWHLPRHPLSFLAYLYHLSLDPPPAPCHKDLQCHLNTSWVVIPSSFYDNIKRLFFLCLCVTNLLRNACKQTLANA